MHAVGRGVKPAHQEDDEDSAPYTGTDLSTYDASKPVALSKQERELMSSMRRRTTDDTEEEETETNPLSAQAKAAMLGKHVDAARERAHGPGLQGLCCSVNAAGDTAVVGCQNSKLLVVNTHTMELMQTIDLLRSGPDTAASSRPSAYAVPEASACAAVRYISSVAGGHSSATVVAAKGSCLLHVHVSTAKVLSCIDEGTNKINNVVIRHDGQAFASCGSDQSVRLYDQQTLKLLTTLDHGDGIVTTGHSNDVFGLAWSAEDPNVLVSAGWDHTVQVWDVRLQRSVRSIYGPHVCGDALAVRDGAVLAGSWRHAAPLEVWDLGSCRLRTRLPFHQPEQDACKLYAAGFSGGAEGAGAGRAGIFAGGSGTRPCVKLFTKVGELIGTAPMRSSVNSIHSADTAKGHFLAVCCSNELKIIDLKA